MASIISDVAYRRGGARGAAYRGRGIAYGCRGVYGGRAVVAGAGAFTAAAPFMQGGGYVGGPAYSSSYYGDGYYGGGGVYRRGVVYGTRELMCGAEGSTGAAPLSQAGVPMLGDAMPDANLREVGVTRHAGAVSSAVSA
jgi:hypothetical protein